MQPKPAHLGPSYAAQFQDASVVAAYRYRPPYPLEAIDRLAALVSRDCRTVLEAGCGTGEIARALCHFVDRIDAVDVSEAMIQTGRQMPGGDHPNLTWIHGAIETVDLHPPYGLVVAAESIHWMDWEVVIRRFHEATADDAFLAVVERGVTGNTAWNDLLPVIQAYSTNGEFAPYDIIDELASRHLFTPVGEIMTKAVLFRLSVDDYIESLHSRNGLSRDRMPSRDAISFDDEVRRVLGAHGYVDDLPLSTYATVTWGTPGSGRPS